MDETVSICRSFDVPLRNGARISVRGSHAKTANFLTTLLPGKTVEHVGRETYFGTDRPQPTSMFFTAVHECFSRHFALTLRPELLMQLIACEVATTVKLYPDEYRHLFTTVKDRTSIKVLHDGLLPGNKNSPWNEAIALFEVPLRERVPSSIIDQLLPPFSTATSESRTASMIAFMDAASPFYEYRVCTMCGIPRVNLAGTPDDYRALYSSAQSLSTLFAKHLGRYFEHLLPVLKKLADQAAGDTVDTDFWSSIYKYKAASNSNNFNGWLTTLVNYVTNDRNGSQGGLIAKNDNAYDWEASSPSMFGIPGLTLGSVPSQVSVVPFVWSVMGGERNMLFAGGPLGVEVVNDSLMPILSYAVLNT